jgi:hypothetical protein
MVANTRGKIRSGPVRPLNLPTQLEVIQGSDKNPKSIGIPLHVDVTVILDSWHIRTRWWRKEEIINRRYFECLMQDGRRVTIFLDLEKSKWFHQRT